MGELEHSSRPTSRDWRVPTSKGGGNGRGKGRNVIRRGREEGKGKGGRKGEGRLASHTIFRP